MSEGVLRDYFSMLAAELDARSENLTVIVDNAHIPLHFEEDDPKEEFSSSLSALDTAHFPPPFLKEDNRWSSMKGSAAGDVSLSLPNRSEDPLDDWVDKVISDERKSLAPHFSMDTTERMLRALPLENAARTRRGRRRQNRDPPKSPVRTKDDDLPSLKNYPYSEKVEAHPKAGIRRLSGDVTSGFSELLSTDSIPFAPTLVDDSNDSKFQNFDYSLLVLDSSKSDLNGKVDTSEHPKVRLSKSRWAHPESPKESAHDDVWLKRRDLCATPSPKALSDFPYAKLSPRKTLTKPPRTGSTKASPRSRPSILSVVVEK